MKPFTYHSPRELPEAVSLLEQHGPDARVIAGGQTLLLDMKERRACPSALVSLAEVADLRGWRYTDTGALEVGATTTYATLAAADLRGWHRSIAAVAGDLADRPVRTMGTIGGALCAAEPRFDMVTVAVAFAAELDLIGPEGVRTVPAAGFFAPAGGTLLRPGEILTAVRFPPPATFSGAAFEKFRYRVFDAALVSAACAVRADGDRISDARLTIGAVHPAPVAATAAAARLAGRAATETDPDTIGRAAADEVLAAAQAALPQQRYQRELVAVLAARAISRAVGQALSTTVES